MIYELFIQQIQKKWKKGSKGKRVVIVYSGSLLLRGREEGKGMIHRRTRSRMVVDSEEERRMDEQKRQEQEEERQRRQQRRRRKIERAAKEKERQKRQEEIRKMSEQLPKNLFDEDSDSGDDFPEVEEKISVLYSNSQRIQDEDERPKEDRDLSQSCKEQHQTESMPTKSKMGQQVKGPRAVQRIQISQEKQQLIKELAVRWWYALPKWPPQNTDYPKLLRMKGYRLVDNIKYRFQENIVQGMAKACPIPGYQGLFKAQNRIIDLRPKQTCPSLANLRKKTIKQLKKLLFEALKNQYKQLQRVPHKTNSEFVLFCGLEQKLREL